jgi:hypothetical protein
MLVPSEAQLRLGVDIVAAEFYFDTFLADEVNISSKGSVSPWCERS